MYRVFNSVSTRFGSTWVKRGPSKQRLAARAVNGHARAVQVVVMLKFAHLTRNGLMAVTLLASPLFSQTDPNRPADTSTTVRADEHRDGFNMGWLGLLGLAGLAGMRRKSSVPVTHTAGDAARVYPSKA